MSVISAGFAIVGFFVVADLVYALDHYWVHHDRERHKATHSRHHRRYNGVKDAPHLDAYELSTYSTAAIMSMAGMSVLSLYAPPSDVTRVYTHEANYHPDGGQIFFPLAKAPFVALLARPGDDVRAEDFVAFWFDGTRGIHIDPGVWHQPIFPVGTSAAFDNRQGRVHACVSINFVGELGVYIEVPLAPPA